MRKPREGWTLAEHHRDSAQEWTTAGILLAIAELATHFSLLKMWKQRIRHSWTRWNFAGDSSCLGHWCRVSLHIHCQPAVTADANRSSAETDDRPAATSAHRKLRPIPIAARTDRASPPRSALRHVRARSHRRDSIRPRDEDRLRRAGCKAASIRRAGCAFTAR